MSLHLSLKLHPRRIINCRENIARVLVKKLIFYLNNGTKLSLLFFLIVGY